jgi:hypothetical protein
MTSICMSIIDNRLISIRSGFLDVLTGNSYLDDVYIKHLYNSLVRLYLYVLDSGLCCE